ncbi:MAG: ABC-2 type transport system ATP-binding protein [Planctomycetota bacterium]
MRGLCRTFGSVCAVESVDLDIEPGTVTGILGPNGSGKSTTLRMINGLVRPDSGTATVAGVELTGDGTAVRRVATFAPGEIALYGEMFGGEHLAWLLRGRPRAAVTKAKAIADRLGLPPKKKVHAYSHGMKRQLLFAAAMGPDVPVRILDEPTEGLDPAKRQEVLEMIGAEAEAGGLVLLSSHHLSEVQAVCTRMIFFHDGRVIADESPADLARRARRSANLEYESEGQASALAASLQQQLGPESSGVIESAIQDSKAVLVQISGDDPRPFLAALAGHSGPAPLSLELGKLSLVELYRTVYGVTGL